LYSSELLDKLSLTDEELPQFDDPDEMKKKLGRIFTTKTQVREYEINMFLTTVGSIILW